MAGSLPDANDDLSPRVFSQTELVGLPGLGERERALDDDPEPAGLDELCELDQLRAIRGDDEESAARISVRDRARRWRDRDDPHVVRKKRPRARGDLTTDGIDDQVNGRHRRGEGTVLTIDHDVGAEVSRELEITSRGDRDHVRALRCASCTAKLPTPPAAPWMSTRSPATRCPWSNSACHAVSPESG